MCQKGEGIQSSPRELIPVPASAELVLHEIQILLEELLQLSCASCLDPMFTSKVLRFYELVEKYQFEVFKTSPYKPSCGKGCSWCCNHWVEDVNSFEAEIIAHYIQTNLPDMVGRITEICGEDERVLEQLDQLVQDRVASLPSDEERNQIDTVDLLLSTFYQLERPCPLLGPDNSCLIYAVRPMTCRIYYGMSDPMHCSPKYINEIEIPTYLLDLNEAANDILDKMHFRYERFAGVTGLRSLVARYLQA